MPHLLEMFDRVRIINLVDRADRRREMDEQIARIGGFGDGRIAYHAAHRPADPGGFPSLGARGCFESHLGVLREARDAGARSLLLLEDDLDFSRDVMERAPPILAALAGRPWSFFYGAHRYDAPASSGLVPVPAGEGVVTAAFLAFDGPVIPPLVDWLEAVLTRPLGSPDYGPMHVDGAYSVYRSLRPALETFAALPALGDQRSSRSDITASGMILDRFGATRPLANFLRRTKDRMRG